MVEVRVSFTIREANYFIHG